MSLGSASELDTQIEIARKIGLGESSKLETLQSQANMVSRMLQGLIHSAKKKNK
ncbi:four helix bundle protein [Dehalococcoidia bacterium]|nr:four helix bundle protein [Dehalococcoidia bacterium]MCL0056438.1 four helix bundle protein [Dehalococcoidia bacterium]MCL0090715.1 four helix bundle protein [Dehalococcoidia bacterium]MCL0098984.1 four helix bundle protein [Dehalococcoidia bacterium]